MAYKILVVDDNDDNLLLVTKILELEGYQVSVAHNGVEAMAKVAAVMPDLAILDVMMPDINGFDLCKEMRGEPLNVTIPIIMLTALNSVNDRVRAREMGADDIWSKPFDLDVFRQNVENLLAQERR